jgi:hypothetical protein
MHKIKFLWSGLVGLERGRSEHVCLRGVHIPQPSKKNSKADDLAQKCADATLGSKFHVELDSIISSAWKRQLRPEFEKAFRTCLVHKDTLEAEANPVPS